MAIICALRFNAESGAMVGDEEYWLLRRRKSYFTDNLYQLINKDIAEELGIEAVYGGWGYPAFHYEVMAKSRSSIADLHNKGQAIWDEKKNLRRIAALSNVVIGHYHDVIRRRVDETLRFLYGFTTSDLTRGFFEENGSKYDIAQEAVKTNALKIVNWSDKRAAMKPVYENRGVLMGYDKEDGFSMYNFNGEKHVSCFVSGGFEAVGRGQYASGQAFAQFLNHKFLANRRQGFDRVEGMVQVLHASHMAADHYHEAGGMLSIVYINGAGQHHQQRYYEFTDDRAKLATEIVRAFAHNHLTKSCTYELIDGLLFQNEQVDAISSMLFERAHDPETLELLLRGYKCDWTAPELKAASGEQAHGEDEKQGLSAGKAKSVKKEQGGAKS